MRKDIVRLVHELASAPGIEEVAMTTNGLLLGPLAMELANAGLRRVNVSLNAVDPRIYEQITGSDSSARVTAAVHRAIEAGLAPVRINCVVIGSANLSQVTALAELSLHLPVWVRFIEYCPTSTCAEPKGWYVPNRKVRKIIESRFGRLSDRVLAPPGGPAVYFKVPGAIGAIGFISGRSSMFCGQCSRLRLTCDGRVKPCLYTAHSSDILGLLRNGGDDRAIAAAIANCLQEKPRYTRLTSSAADFSMRSIGG